MGIPMSFEINLMDLSKEQLAKLVTLQNTAITQMNLISSDFANLALCGKLRDEHIAKFVGNFGNLLSAFEDAQAEVLKGSIAALN